MGACRHTLVVVASLLLGAASLSAQDATGAVTGRVISGATDEPLQGAIVRIAERSAVTGAGGRFHFAQVPAGTHTLRVSLIGYVEETRSVTVAAGETVTMEIPLAVDVIVLAELTVIGYGERRAADLTGSVRAVASEEFNTGRLVSMEELIQGKVAGVQVIDTGEPGGGVSLRIRGGTSVTSSNEPLFVIDGVPVPVGGGISAGRNPFNFLNPGDIESVTVLKDASATAIYGSRGANGVILIETRSGTRSPQLSYSSSVSSSHVTRRPNLLNADQFRRAVEENASFALPLLDDANTDWQRAIERSATIGQEHNVAFAGATDDIDYRFSLGYLDQQGALRASSTERVSGSLNYGHRLLDDRLHVRANLVGSRTKDEFTPGGVIGGANTFAPTQPIEDPNSPYGGFFEWEDPLTPNNPVAEQALTFDEGTTFRSLGNVTAGYQVPFLEGLVTTVKLGYDVTKAERAQFFPSFLRWQSKAGISGQVNRSNPTEVNRLLDVVANYETHLDRYDSRIDLTAGYSYEDSRSDFPSFVAENLSSDLLGAHGVPAAEVVRPFLSVQESRLVSGFARLNYALRDRYLFTASLRRDGSSRFGPLERWGTFPSAAIAWRIVDEPFMERFENLVDLKLRASWGVNGNQAFANYQAFSDFVIGDAQTQVQFGDEFVTTIRPSAADPSIKWEETTSYNLGVDYGLFGGRLLGSVDWYYKETEDLIFTVPVAAGTNLSNFVTTNIGTMTNRGFEFAVDAIVAEAASGGLSWLAHFNASTNRNRLTQISPFGGGERILVGGISGGVGNTIQVLQPGYPVNSFFVLRHRLDENGRPIASGSPIDMYEDLTGDGSITVDDRAPFRSPDPDWVFGHTSRFGLGSFDASLSLRAHLGNYVYNNVASFVGHYRALTWGGAPNNLHASVLEHGFETEQFFSDVYIENASFLKMDNISVGYTFRPFRTGEEVRVFGTAQNLFTLTGYSGVDPEAGVNGIDNNLYPRSRTFSTGFSVQF